MNVPKTLLVCSVAAERRGTVAKYAGVAADRAGNVAEHTSVFGDVARSCSGRRKCGTTRWCRRGEMTRWRKCSPKWEGDPRGWRGNAGGLGSILKRSSDKCRIRHNFALSHLLIAQTGAKKRNRVDNDVYSHGISQFRAHGRDMECERTQFEGGFYYCITDWWRLRIENNA